MRFFDAHSDTVRLSMAAGFEFILPPLRPNMDLPRLLEAGLAAQVFAVFARPGHIPGTDLRAYADSAIDTIVGWAAHSNGRMRLALTAADVREAAAGRGFYGLIGLEGADPLGDRAENLVHFFERGVRLVIAAWGDNAFSGTSNDDGGPLTSEGIKLIELCESLRCMVDVSHLSDAAFEQVCSLAHRPFVASHSACRGLCRHPRNLTDEMIRKVADRGGVMGIPASPWFLDDDCKDAIDAVLNAAMAEAKAAIPDPFAAYQLGDRWGRERGAALPLLGMESIVRHIQHAMQVGGEDSVGLGGDLDGVEFLVHGMTGIESYPALAEQMRQAGLTESQVEKVCWRNMGRVFEEVLPQA